MFTLPKLPYEYDALEPYIDEETMRLHHTKHHQTYIDKLNQALEGNNEWADKSIDEIMTNLSSVPQDIQTAVRNHGGGHANHSFFWQILRSPQESNEPAGQVAELINQKFGSLSDFQTKFTEAATGVFGSGWAWLVQDKGGELNIIKTANQDSPLSLGHKPLLGIDVWEHAYYLKYQNRRAEYVANFFKLINWEEVNSRLEA